MSRSADENPAGPRRAAPQALVGTEDIRALLERTVAAHRDAARSPASRHVWELLRRTVTQGKFVRPYLVLTVATLAGTSADPERLERAHAVGAAFEMLHGALVIHDDIMDGDLLRRGQPTVPAATHEQARRGGAADPDRVGTAAAIIAGDLALAAAYGLLADAGPAAAEITGIMDRAVRDTAEGQILDVSGALREDTSEEAVLEAARLKTGVYSFEAPIAAGAALAGLAEPARAALLAGARDLGIAFQVVDDVIGTFGEEESTGKSASSDLLARKLTILSAHAVGRPGWAQAWEALAAGGPEDRAAATARARRLLVDLGSLEHARELSHRLHDSARAAFTDPAVPEPIARALLDLTDTLEARRR